MGPAMAAVSQVHFFKQGQIWEAGFDGLYNTDDAVDSVTSKVGARKTGRRAAESKTQQIVRQRERHAFERAVESRAEQFKDAFSKLDLDGDGKLSFEEFSNGLQSLGVLLPQREVEAIWSQVPFPHPQAAAGFRGRLRAVRCSDSCAARHQEVGGHQAHGMEQQAPRDEARMGPSPDKDASSHRQDSGGPSSSSQHGMPARRAAGMRPVRTSIAVEPFTNHRNECDHIIEHLQEPVDGLQSPLKGSRRAGETPRHLGTSDCQSAFVKMKLQNPRGFGGQGQLRSHGPKARGMAGAPPCHVRGMVGCHTPWIMPRTPDHATLIMPRTFDCS